MTETTTCLTTDVATRLPMETVTCPMMEAATCPTTEATILTTTEATAIPQPENNKQKGTVTALISFPQDQFPNKYNRVRSAISAIKQQF